MKYERTDVEFEEADKPADDLYSSPLCVHCGKSLGYHWQEADDKIYCTREVADAKGVEQ